MAVSRLRHLPPRYQCIKKLAKSSYQCRTGLWVLITSAKEVIFHRRLSACLSVCLLTSSCKTTDQILIKILPQIYSLPYTLRQLSPTKFWNEPDSLWRWPAISECSCVSILEAGRRPDWKCPIGMTLNSD